VVGEKWVVGEKYPVGIGIPGLVVCEETVGIVGFFGGFIPGFVAK
jgi:hypothetical protein